MLIPVEMQFSVWFSSSYFSFVQSTHAIHTKQWTFPRKRQHKKQSADTAPSFWVLETNACSFVIELVRAFLRLVPRGRSWRLLSPNTDLVHQPSLHQTLRLQRLTPIAFLILLCPLHLQTNADQSLATQCREIFQAIFSLFVFDLGVCRKKKRVTWQIKTVAQPGELQIGRHLWLFSLLRPLVFRIRDKLRIFMVTELIWRWSQVSVDTGAFHNQGGCVVFRRMSWVFARRNILVSFLFLETVCSVVVHGSRVCSSGSGAGGFQTDLKTICVTSWTQITNWVLTKEKVLWNTFWQKSEVVAVTRRPLSGRAVLAIVPEVLSGTSVKRKWSSGEHFDSSGYRSMTIALGAGKFRSGCLWCTWIFCGNLGLKSSHKEGAELRNFINATNFVCAIGSICILVIDYIWKTLVHLHVFHSGTMCCFNQLTVMQCFWEALPAESPYWWRTFDWQSSTCFSAENWAHSSRLIANRRCNWSWVKRQFVSIAFSHQTCAVSVSKCIANEFRDDAVRMSKTTFSHREDCISFQCDLSPLQLGQNPLQPRRSLFLLREFELPPDDTASKTEVQHDLSFLKKYHFRASVHFLSLFRGVFL